MLNWAYSEGHPHTDGTFTRTLVNVGTFAGTLVNVRELLVNMALCCETFFPLQHSKTPRTPNLSRRLFLGVPVRGSNI